MKKIYSIAILSVFVAGSAVAGPGMHNNHNKDMNTVTITTFVEPVVDEIVTVEQIPMMRDNQNVVMTGYVVENLGDEMYVFQDSTGTIHVEIEPVVLGEMMLVPNTKMKIKGEIDKGSDGEPDVIEVDYITTM
ncbi:MAG: YgiW/YdeI family stress tolerance OB fold protein [Alphaproteobacteria bacterium]